MPDITMCEGNDGGVICPKRAKCYRYTATPTPHRQAYFVGLPIYKDGQTLDGCTYFMRNDER